MYKEQVQKLIADGKRVKGNAEIEGEELSIESYTDGAVQNFVDGLNFSQLAQATEELGLTEETTDEEWGARTPKEVLYQVLYWNIFTEVYEAISNETSVVA